MKVNNMTFNPPKPKEKTEKKIEKKTEEKEEKLPFRFIVRLGDEDEEDEEEENVTDEKTDEDGVPIVTSVSLSDVPYDPNHRPIYKKIDPVHLDHVGAAIETAKMLQELYLEENQPLFQEYNEIQEMHEVLAFREFEIETECQQQYDAFWQDVDLCAWANVFEAGNDEEDEFFTHMEEFENEIELLA